MLCQPYLVVCNIRKYRFNLTGLRISSHRLRIESGRWSKPNPTPVEQRLCIVCNRLEDEYHFVIECNLYTDLRVKYIPLYYRNRPNMQTIIELMSSDSESVLRKLSAFVHAAFLVRSTNMYAPC